MVRTPQPPHQAPWISVRVLRGFSIRKPEPFDLVLGRGALWKGREMTAR